MSAQQGSEAIGVVNNVIDLYMAAIEDYAKQCYLQHLFCL